MITNLQDFGMMDRNLLFSLCMRLLQKVIDHEMRPHEIAEFLKIYRLHDTRDAFYYSNAEDLWEHGVSTIEEFLLLKK